MWTWVASDSDSKLVPAYLVGSRDAVDGYRFMSDLAGRPIGFNSPRTPAYLIAVEAAFGSDIHYAEMQALLGPA